VVVDSSEQRVVIRRLAPADVPWACLLARRAFSDFSPRAESAAHGMFAESAATTLIAARGGEPLGFAVVERRGDGRASLQAIAVEGAERGRGIGTRLVNAAIHLAQSMGARELDLWTAQANVEALAVFLKVGFRIEARKPRFYARGQDACRLVRSLA
jgi:ribosomal protein S18 acetylase RimI-like enzyme